MQPAGEDATFQPFRIPPHIELPSVECPAVAPATASSLFGGKRTLLVSVPGAFTAICDAVHLPGFVERADEIKALGYDPVFVAVNDSAVMAAWGRARGRATGS
eukprot:SAG22_NODE_1407_length_4489_cov_3.308884_4_plen_103_part_00